MRKRLLIATALGALMAALALAGCTSPAPTSPSSAQSDADGANPAPDDYVVIEPISDDDPIAKFAANSTAVVLGPPAGADGSLKTAAAAGAADTPTIAVDWAPNNSCYSPVSLYLAMAMVGAGADGAAQQQVLGALNMTDANELKRYCKQALDSLDEGYDAYELEIANSIWAKEGFAFSRNYLEVADDIFDADAFSVNFGTPDANSQMSRWVAEETKGLLKPEFQTTDAQVAALINTLYFKDAWTDPFEASNTAPSTFHALSGDVQADFMHLPEHNTSYLDGDGYAAADLAFTGGGTMRFVLPDEGVDLQSLISTPEKISELMWMQLDFGQVNWSVPKFTIDSSWKDLIADMQALGVTDIFSDSIPGMFAGMLDNADGSPTGGHFRVSDLIQETHLALNEEGVEAAAYTAVGMEVMSALPEGEPIEFVLDRPFLYIVAAPNGMPLFIGTVQNPA